MRYTTLHLRLRTATASIVLEITGSKKMPGVENQPAATVVQLGFEEDSTVHWEQGGIAVLLQGLITLPPGPIEMGETVTIPGWLPFSGNGTPLRVCGETRLKLIEVEKGVATFEVELAFDKLEVPKALSHDFEFSMTGAGRSRFDTRTRRFVGSEIESRTVLGMTDRRPADEGPDMNLRSSARTRVRMQLAGQ